MAPGPRAHSVLLLFLCGSPLALCPLRDPLFPRRGTPLYPSRPNANTIAASPLSTAAHTAHSL
jgi:hypothetical protein